MLKKTGEVKSGITVCDKCSEAAVVVVGRRALCNVHSSDSKQASLHDNTRINAMTDPVEDMVSAL
jgi:hypothetical protein